MYTLPHFDSLRDALDSIPNQETTMTPVDIARYNETNAALTAEDLNPRTTWEQHCAAFDQPVPAAMAAGSKVVAWDSSTMGTVGEFRDGQYDVTFPDMSGTFRYPASQLRPWPVA